MKKKSGFIPDGFKLDDADRAFLESMGCWHRHSSGYLVRFIRDEAGKKIKLYAHRVIMEHMNGCPLPEKLVIDHKNRDPMDNRRENLRLVTHRQNCLNTSHAKGYTKLANGKYRAIIKVNGKAIELGHWSTPEEARAAYLTAKKFLHKI